MKGVQLMVEMITIPKGGRPHKANKPDKETLYREYIVENQTVLAMAERYQVARATMARWLHEAGCRKK